MPDLQALRNKVERFIAEAVEPAILDPGEEPLALIAGQWNFTEWSGRLVLEAWAGHRNLVRKIDGLKLERRDQIALLTERFPKTRGELQIADLAAPNNHELSRKTSRAAFRERFQLMLAREFPLWTVEEVSCDANLEQSLSPSYARAFLRLGPNGIAAVAAPPDAPDPAGIVATGLIWADYLRHREKTLSISMLALYLPLKREAAAALRAAWIDPAAVRCELFAYDDRDRCGAIDFADSGNVESTLPPCRRPEFPNGQTLSIGGMPGDVTSVEQSDGSLSMRIRGLEFARAAGGKLTCGIARRTRCSAATAVAMANEVARVRTPDAVDRQHPLYLASPEGWLESLVREMPAAIDASLLAAPLYGQVPVFTGGDRGVIDLLGIDHTGRLVVIEIKATADLQLPFQALDYWLRVRKHLAAGDFERLGYFAGHVIRAEPPRILLVAPALEFHSTIETLLAALSPSIEITRVGLAADWRRGLRVMFRLQGAEHPG
ncbi:MAG TPA: hypothetical protein VG273_26960 [Bryobacteraceae bacterium]|nr:hypothetical protein [Bryobacteraceae bacterium]